MTLHEMTELAGPWRALGWCLQAWSLYTALSLGHYPQPRRIPLLRLAMGANAVALAIFACYLIQTICPACDP